MEIFDALIYKDQVVYSKIKNLDVKKIKNLNCLDEIDINGEKYTILKKNDYIILDKLKCLEEFKKQAFYDGLTGCFLKKQAEIILKKLIKSAIRYNQPLSILLFDIDFFKKINDTYGHLVGDYVLKELAKLVLSQIRESDICGRVGGEEFLIILPNTKLIGALKLAERLRLSVESYEFIYGGKKIPVTISIGITSLSKNDSFESLYERVDEALYLAKKSGRNRVEYK